MKNYTQVYVKNSVEAAQHYCDAFGAEVTRAFWNGDRTAWCCSPSARFPGIPATRQ